MAAVRDEILRDLNPAQRQAVEAVTGPVVILAGAGSGKTTTITRRIANQVRSGAFEPQSILAVTFTTKAAGELGDRLSALNVRGVQTRTFHSAALRQVERLGNTKVDVLEGKARILSRVRDGLPKQHRDHASIGDLASEIERAKTNRLTPETYPDGRGPGWPPLPPELMRDVFAAYETEKRRQRKFDFEDLMEQAIRILEHDDRAAARFRAACRAITVDEYQDVNLLQQTLLDLWLGERDDVCVVGDDYQSIFAFAGASPRYLVEMRERFKHGTIVKLELNYRSSPQILELANRLAPKLGGIEKRLRATNGEGPQPTIHEFKTFSDELDAITARISGLIASGIEPREIGVLYRINARSVDIEMALAEAGIPFQVARGGFLERQAAKGMISRLRRQSHVTAVRARVEELAHDAGFIENPHTEALGPQEYTRQLDLGQLIGLAGEFDDGTRTTGEFIAHLHERFGSWESSETRNAVRLTTFHLAKGLEWDAVFLPGVAERELPFWRAIEDGSIDEERRLFYVGLTRPRRHLWISYSGAQLPSSFLDEIGEPTPPTAHVTGHGSGNGALAKPDGPTRQTKAPPSPLSETEVESLLDRLPSTWLPSRASHARAYVRWTDDEDVVLAHFREAGQSYEQIALTLKRRPAAVRSRLVKLGVVAAP